MSSYNFPCPPDYEMKVTEDALALAVSGNTAPSGGLTAGKYIFLTGHSTLPDGGYHVKDTDIGAGETLSASNIEADGEGFANALNAKVSELNSKLMKITGTTQNITVNRNSEWYDYITNYTSSDNWIPSGYTVVSVFTIGFSNANAHIFRTGWYVRNGNLALSLKNASTGSGSDSTTVDFVALLMKT